jgi:hypothetical protein
MPVLAAAPHSISHAPGYGSRIKLQSMAMCYFGRLWTNLGRGPFLPKAYKAQQQRCGHFFISGRRLARQALLDAAGPKIPARELGKPELL